MSMVHRLTVPIVFPVEIGDGLRLESAGNRFHAVQRRLIQAEKADKIQTKLNGW